MKIALDIDGVLADFVTPFLQLLEQRVGGPSIDPASITDPNFQHHPFLTKELIYDCMVDTSYDAEFWRVLSPLPSTDQWQALNQVSRDNEVVFITHRWVRDTYDINQVTCDWLRRHGIDSPVVHFTQEVKSQLVRKLAGRAVRRRPPRKLRRRGDANRGRGHDAAPAIQPSIRPSESAAHPRFKRTVRLSFKQVRLHNGGDSWEAIDNKVAIVTGGGGGIGGAIVQRFAREGAKLAVADINPQAAQARVKEVADRGTDAIAITSDVTNKKSVQDMVTATLDRWGKIDILVNVAGGAQRKNVVDITAEDWDHVVNMNLKSVFLCSQAVLPTMLKAKYGKIVSISSIYGFAGNATRSSYAAAKAGVAVFTKSLALEHVKDGININAIAPGRIETPAVRGHYSDEAWAAAEAQIPMGHTGKPENIASAAIFLVQDENNYITGQTIHVNGAWLNW